MFVAPEGFLEERTPGGALLALTKVRNRPELVRLAGFDLDELSNSDLRVGNRPDKKYVVVRLAMNPYERRRFKHLDQEAGRDLVLVIEAGARSRSALLSWRLVVHGRPNGLGIGLF
jgi:hypothetical protein